MLVPLYHEDMPPPKVEYRADKFENREKRGKSKNRKRRQFEKEKKNFKEKIFNKEEKKEIIRCEFGNTVLVGVLVRGTNSIFMRRNGKIRFLDQTNISSWLSQ